MHSTHGYDGNPILNLDGPWTGFVANNEQQILVLSHIYNWHEASLWSLTSSRRVEAQDPIEPQSFYADLLWEIMVPAMKGSHGSWKEPMKRSSASMSVTPILQQVLECPDSLPASRHLTLRQRKGSRRAGGHCRRQRSNMVQERLSRITGAHTGRPRLQQERRRTLLDRAR
jgi:hypothetical protein